MQKNPQFYGSLVWFLSGLALFTYATLGLLGTKIPGVEELVAFVQQADGHWIFAAAFLSIFFEGLYIVGNFIPGSTMILIVAVISGLKSFSFFISIIATIFIGWVLAGFINISVAKVYRHKIQNQAPKVEPIEIKDRLLITWFPAYRANYEVSQIAEGGNFLKVFFSSLRVRFFASLAAAVGTFIASKVLNVSAISNEEGFLSVVAVGMVSVTVGIWKLKIGARK